MIKWLLLIFTLAATAVTAQQQQDTDRPELNITLEPNHIKAGGAYVQGQIRLRVQLISLQPFSELNLDLPPFAGVRTVTLSQPRTRQIKTYGRTKCGRPWRAPSRS